MAWLLVCLAIQNFFVAFVASILMSVLAFFAFLLTSKRPDYCFGFQFQSAILKTKHQSGGNRGREFVISRGCKWISPQQCIAFATHLQKKVSCLVKCMLLIQNLARKKQDPMPIKTCYRHVDKEGNVILHSTQYMFCREVQKSTTFSWETVQWITRLTIFNGVIAPLLFLTQPWCWNSLHVAVDILYLRKLYPEKFEMFVDKELQYLFFKKHAVKMHPLIGMTKRFKISEVLRPSQSRVSIPNTIFVKNRYSGWGEDCKILRRDEVKESKPNLLKHLVFEEPLKNHSTLRRIFGSNHSLVTVRVWTQRWKCREHGIYSCILVGDKLSNEPENKAYEIDSKTGGCVLENGTELTIPWHKNILLATQNFHDKASEFPFIGWDWAVTDEGPVFIEGNLEASFDRYFSKLGSSIRHFAYTLEDVADFVDEKALMLKNFGRHLPKSRTT
eukprot:jgi/Bigna1/90989/estExt_fgenesh1_pg.C_850045